MAGRRWDEMWELFHQAAELAPGQQRQDFLAEACPDEEVRGEVERLLAAHDRAPRLLDPLGDSPTAESPLDPLIGGQIGPYHIERLIGEGGMGRVYTARQEEPIRRRVAIKVIKLGMDTREVVARFESERQALALMDHPHIAKVLDAGATDQGRPYFVMELVSGAPICRWCDDARLTVRERLELLIPVCRAVHHAHQKGIIHRDLKPANILVAERDDRPAAVVIDFGVAKATEQRLTEMSLATAQGMLVGTPEYMSPEQAGASPDIDTRTDVYALGMVLYELLAGRLPFDLEELRQGSFLEIARTIRESRLPTPSRRLSSLGGAMETVAAARATEPAVLQRELRGELDWIVMKALDKDRERRYQSASELAVDLERHLRHQPVVAGPPTTGYRVRKFVRRHRVGVAAVSALIVSLTLGIAGSTRMAVVASRERRVAVAAQLRAQEEAEIARAVNQTLDSLLGAADPYVAAGGPVAAADVKVVDVLDRADDALAELADQPAVEAELRTTIGKSYFNLGLDERAQAHFERSVELWRRVHGDDHPKTLVARTTLAAALDRPGGDLAAAEELLRPNIESLRRVLGEEHEDTLIATGNLAALLYDRGEFDEALSLLRELIPRQQRAIGDDHFATLNARSVLAVVLSDQGEHAEAGTIIRDVLERERRVWGEDDPRTLYTLNILATILEKQSALEEAEVAFRELVRLNEQVYGRASPLWLLAAHNLGSVLAQLGRLDEAGVLLREVKAGYDDVHGPFHPHAMVATHSLARTLTEAGLPGEAAALYRDLVERARETFPPDHIYVATFEGGLGLALLRMERYAEAEAYLLANRRTLVGIFGTDHRRTLVTDQRLVELYEAWGRPEMAAEYRSSASGE
jgi:non-specific serine/threonine protein kinase/serine/threonine-protein kinase